MLSEITILYSGIIKSCPTFLTLNIQFLSEMCHVLEVKWIVNVATFNFISLTKDLCHSSIFDPVSLGLLSGITFSGSDPDF